MDVQQIEELLPFYAMDALTEEERALVEEYLTGHPEARRQVEEMSRTVSALPQAVAPVEPRPQVRQALMKRVVADAGARAPSSAESQPSRRGIRWESFFRTFSLVMAAVAIGWVILLNMQVAGLQSLEKIITNLPQTNPSNVITVSLKGTEAQPQAQGQLLVNPNSQSAVLVIAGLPPLEAGRTYQVWLIAGGAPVSAGLLTVDQNGQGVFVVTSEEEIGSFNSLGISIEPEGGSPQPTGDIVVLSDL
jgi:anti-sigma-K factor RskA